MSLLLRITLYAMKLADPRFVLLRATCLLLLVVGLSSAITCGNWATEPCIGDRDKRYDPDASADLEDLDPLYSRLDGYWAGEITAFDGDKTPLEPQFATSANTPLLGIPYRRTDTSAFWNITLKGTRYLQHDVHVYGPADIAFCNETRSPGFRNVLDDGLCGMNGYASGADVFRTSTHELDSTCVFVWGTGIYAAPTITANIGRPIGDQVMYFGSESFDSFFSSQTIVLSSDFNSLSVSTATYLLVRGRPIFLSTETSGTLRRMAEPEFEEAIMEALEMNNVTQTTRNSITIPVNGCLVEPCPTDEMWCETDPNCSESPYEENATVKGGVIAGFTILGAFILIAGIVALYQYKINRIKQKAKFKFSKRMAQSFHHIVNDSALVTPEELIEEFHKIESNDGEGGDGLISKAEMWLFVTSKDGDMTEKEFDVLFAAVDKNKSGMIDFAEFCAFICELNNNNKNG